MLQLFYSNPNRPFYVREITRKINEQINSVRRELANLLSIGIIVSDNTNNKLYYEVNQKYEYYRPFSTVFGRGGRTAGDAVKASKSLDPQEKDRLKGIGRIELLVYTGQFTRDESSGVDILVVGEVNQNALQKYVSELEDQENKELRYTVMPLSEFSYRRQIKDRFVTTVLSSKKQVIVDNVGAA